jgi:thiamine-phosphate pyrophosphorylase
MPCRQPLPKIWLFTDPKLGDQLLPAIQRLPFGSGVVFRHYHLDDHDRHQLFRTIQHICKRRGHRILLASSPSKARQWRADGVHGAERGYALLRSAPVHNFREIAKAKRIGADIMFLSPVYTTSTHPAARPLGSARFTQLARCIYPVKIVALGGMSRAKAAMWGQGIIHGWAAIDAFKK